MAEPGTLLPPPYPADTSQRALAIGRIIDRLCRTPGTYSITIVVPAHRYAPWQVTFYRLERLHRIEIGR